MDQNSGDGELNTGGSQQCSKQKYVTEEIRGATFVNPGDSESAPDSPPSSIKGGSAETTGFNLGAAPFIASTSSISVASSVHGTSTPPPLPSDVNARLFPWNAIISTSTPNEYSSDGANKNKSNKNGLAKSVGDCAGVGGAVVNSTVHMKDIMELNNRLNSSCGLGPTCSMQSTPISTGGAQLKGKSIPGTTTTSGTPMPGNILRHLTNNNIMGNLLQETNPPPNGILSARNAAEFRAYFNSNLINGNNDLNCLANGSSSANTCVAGTYMQQHHRAQLNGGPQFTGLLGHGNNPSTAMATSNGNGGGGLYHYRFDLENNRQRLPLGPATSLGPPPSMVAATNQFNHIRMPGNLGIPPAEHYGENNFRVKHANGIIQLKLKDGIEIEMTLDGAIRVVNWHCNVSIALASSSNSAALIHPNGRVLQYHSRVEIMTYDGKNKNNFVRFAKIWYKGISFTSEDNALVYLVDSGGTRTTTDTFMDLRNDISEQVFLTGSTHGPAYDNQAKKEVMNHKYWPALDGTEVHELNGFRIAQTVDGMVRITKANKNILVRTSPGNGSATLTTAYMHCTASLGQTSHLFVRRGERRMHFDGAEFVVRNSGHSAGFDSNNLLRVY